jgi:hypothetical protein
MEQGLIKARLTLYGEGAADVARALQPDNLPNMDLRTDGDCLIFEFCTEKIGTLLSTADDILMNLKVAEEILQTSKD